MIFPFIEKSARYANGEIVFRWKHTDGAPGRVFIYPLKDGQILHNDCRSTNLGDSTTSYRMRYGAVGSVSRFKILLFLSEAAEHNPSELKGLLNDSSYVSDVIVGGAAVVYSIKTVLIDNDMESNVLTISSNGFIEEGIMGYTFTFMHSGKKITVPVPDTISNGTKKYPQFFTPRGSDIKLCIINGSNSDVSIKREKSKFCLSDILTLFNFKKR